MNLLSRILSCSINTFPKRKLASHRRLTSCKEECLTTLLDPSNLSRCRMSQTLVKPQKLSNNSMSIVEALILPMGPAKAIGKAMRQSSMTLHSEVMIRILPWIPTLLILISLLGRIKRRTSRQLLPFNMRALALNRNQLRTMEGLVLIRRMNTSRLGSSNSLTSTERRLRPLEGSVRRQTLCKGARATRWPMSSKLLPNIQPCFPNTLLRPVSKDSLRSQQSSEVER